MRSSVRVSALALMAAAMLGASATSAAAYGGESGAPQVNFCGNTAQIAEQEAEDQSLAAGLEQENDGHHPTFCQTGVGNTINNINPDIKVHIEVPETGEGVNGVDNGVSGEKGGKNAA